MAARLVNNPAAGMACLSGQGALLHDQHSCERIQSGGILKLGRREWLGERNFAHARIRLKQRRGGSRMQVRAGLEELASNQVLVSATVAGILGQLAKPFAAALSGNSFNWKLVIKSGGMPSSHSAGVTAVATALAFERGFSDGVFGLSFILACIVMYDAQGVRNAVGKQAKVINTMVVSYMPLPQSQEEQPGRAVTPSPAAIGAELARDPIEAELAFMDNTTTSSSTANQVPSSVATLEGGASPSPSKAAGISQSGAAMETSNGSYTRTRRFFELAEQLPTMKVGEVDIQELGNQDGWRLLPLKESIGHTKIEVFVGGVWGVLITCIFHSLYYS